MIDFLCLIEILRLNMLKLFNKGLGLVFYLLLLLHFLFWLVKKVLHFSLEIDLVFY